MNIFRWASDDSGGEMYRRILGDSDDRNHVGRLDPVDEGLMDHRERPNRPETTHDPRLELSRAIVPAYRGWRMADPSTAHTRHEPELAVGSRSPEELGGGTQSRQRLVHILSHQLSSPQLSSAQLVVRGEFRFHQLGEGRGGVPASL